MGAMKTPGIRLLAFTLVPCRASGSKVSPAPLPWGNVPLSGIARRVRGPGIGNPSCFDHRAPCRGAVAAVAVERGQLQPVKSRTAGDIDARLLPGP